MNPEPATISAVICTLNEAHQIGRCLEALAWCDEVIVVDKFSTDATKVECEKFSNVRFFQRDDWTNPNWNFGQEQAVGDWILRLDADEVASPEMAEEIQTKVLRNPDSRYTGYWVPNRVYFFGKWIRYGVAVDNRFQRAGYGYRKILFKRNTAKYACVSFHEDMEANGEYGILYGHYEHYSHPSVTRWIAKMNHYTDGDVSRKDVLAPDFRMPHPLKTIAALVKIFTYYYIIRRGYRDGTHGFMTCALNTIYVLVERCKVWEKHHHLTHPDNTTQDNLKPSP